MTDHKKAAWEKFKVGQKAAKKTEKEARANFERSYNPDRPNKSAKRAKINPADNSVPAKQLRGNMTEEYMRGLHSPEKMKGWMKQYGIDPRNIPHHGHMVLSSDQHKAAAARRKAKAAAQQAQYTPKASSSKESPIVGDPIEIAGKAEDARERAAKAVGGESAAERARKAVGGDPIDSDTKKAMKTDMLYTLLGIGR